MESKSECEKKRVSKSSEKRETSVSAETYTVKIEKQLKRARDQKKSFDEIMAQMKEFKEQLKPSKDQRKEEN